MHNAVKMLFFNYFVAACFLDVFPIEPNLATLKLDECPSIRRIINICTDISKITFHIVIF